MEDGRSERHHMSYTPSLRQLWRLYKAILARSEDVDRRDLMLAQDAFYAGARAVLKVQAYLLERGRYDELHAMIEKHGRQIDTPIKPARRKRH
jgi:hypothetical protein